MIPASLAGTVDVAQAALILFVGFVLALFVWLRREDKREGYPLEDPAQGRPLVGFPLPPPERPLKLMHGAWSAMPHPEGRDPALLRHGPYPGAPFEPVGDPMQDGVGPASWASKRDDPMKTWEGHPLMQPLRVLPGWVVEREDPDPRGMQVFDADGVSVGHVSDLWLDHGVKILRYLEVALTLPGAPPRALIPIYFAEISSRSNDVRIAALFARHFLAFPQLRDADTITAREEDQVSAYCAGGLLYGTARRQGSFW